MHYFFGGNGGEFLKFVEWRRGGASFKGILSVKFKLLICEIESSNFTYRIPLKKVLTPALFKVLFWAILSYTGCICLTNGGTFLPTVSVVLGHFPTATI
jgi:hypothetical protein